MSDMSDPPFPAATETVKATVSRRLAFEAWDALKGANDPEAEELPQDTQMRIELFAKMVRNATIVQIAGALKRFNDKQNALATETLLAWKE